jgi:hypothetical protein
MLRHSIHIAIGLPGRAWRRIRRDSRGETTEKVIITALFAALALAAATIITIKVTDKAESIPVNQAPASQTGGSGDGTLGE